MGFSNNELHYYITSKFSDQEDISPLRTYGVEIKLYSDNSIIGQARIDDVTSSENKAEKLIEFLSKNCVTPINLREVVEDLFGDSNGLIP